MDKPDPWAETNSSELRKKTIPLGGAKQAILEAQEELQSALRLLDEGIGQVSEEHRLRKFPTSVHEVIHAGRRLIDELRSDVAPTRTWGRDAQDAIDHFNSVMRFYESNPELTEHKDELGKSVVNINKNPEFYIKALSAALIAFAKDERGCVDQTIVGLIEEAEACIAAEKERKENIKKFSDLAYRLFGSVNHP